jgi:hypothetical protein
MYMRKPAIVALLLACPLVAWAEPEGRWVSAAPPASGCTEPVTGSEAVDDALKAVTFDVGGEARPLREVRLTGLSTLDEVEVWRFLGGKPDKPDGLRATTIVRRLASSGLFEQVAPVVSLEGDAVTLTIRVTEQPRLNKVVFEGLTEARPRGLLEALLEAPRNHGRRHDDDDEPGPCAEPRVPAEWLATVDDDMVHPGLVRFGLRRAVQRVVDRLFQRGYHMSILSADLAPDGTLTLKVDEGRIQSLELRGVSPRIEGEVRRLLELHPGAVFDREDLGGAIGRIHAQFPFLESDRRGRLTRIPPRVVEAVRENGRRYLEVERPPVSNGGWSTVEGNKLVLYLRAERAQLDVDGAEILRHTPVTGFAPGLEVRARVWDPSDRLHVTVEVGGNVNSYRARQAQSTLPAGVTGERWRFDWMAGPKVAIPALHVAELGAQAYARVDTSDRWRIDRIDSYLYSMVFNRPDSEYYRRDGLTAFLTTHLFERLTAGVEYRRDEYTSLESPQEKYWTLFRRHEAPPRFTPIVADGTMASMLVRLEFTSAPAPAHQVGVTQRDPERSIVRHGGGYWWSDFHTVNTLEIADPGLGGDQFKFVRVVSDSAAVLLRTARDKGLKVRFRVAGRLSGTLPAQKEEALGGWTAVRGYGFKEERGGNLSMLGTVEYRYRAASAFADIGSLRRTTGGFSPTRTGLGVALNMRDRASLSLAWRTDDRAEIWPEVRLFFNRTY